jgi:hypothetical protein
MIQQPVVNIFPTINDFNEDPSGPRTLIDEFNSLQIKGWVETLLQEERFKVREK